MEPLTKAQVGLTQVGLKRSTRECKLPPRPAPAVADTDTLGDNSTDHKWKENILDVFDDNPGLLLNTELNLLLLKIDT